MNVALIGMTEETDDNIGTKGADVGENEGLEFRFTEVLDGRAIRELVIVVNSPGEGAWNVSLLGFEQSGLELAFVMLTQQAHRPVLALYITSVCGE